MTSNLAVYGLALSVISEPPSLTNIRFFIVKIAHLYLNSKQVGNMKLEKACVYSLNAYNRLYPGSFFGRRLGQEDIKEAKKSIVFLGFCKLARIA